MEPRFPERTDATDELLDLLWGIPRRLRKGLKGDDPLLGVTHEMILHRLSMAGAKDPEEHGGEGNPSRISDIAQWLHLTPAAVTQVVTDLERMGLVQRIRHAHDRRVVSVVLTEAGEFKVRMRVGRRRKVTAEMLGALTDEERGMLLRILRKIASGNQTQNEGRDERGRRY